MEKEKELYYWISQDGTITPKDKLTDIHICHIVCKYGKDWLNENGHSVIVDRFNSLNKWFNFFKELSCKKNKNIIVMCPTVEIATQKCKEFLNANKGYVYRFSKAQLLVGLVNGINIYFKGETEGQRVLRGIHADIIQIDEFPMNFNENKVL